MSIVNPPPLLTPQTFGGFVETLQTGNPAARAAARQAMAVQAANAASARFLQSTLISVTIAGYLTNLALDLQHRLALQEATQLELTQAQRTRQNYQCVFDPTVFPLCPGTGTRPQNGDGGARDFLQNIYNDLEDEYNMLRLVPSLPTWRPWVRAWIREWLRSFHELESLVQSAIVCMGQPEERCRKRVPGIKRVCVNSIPNVLNIGGE